MWFGVDVYGMYCIFVFDNCVVVIGVVGEVIDYVVGLVWFVFVVFEDWCWWYIELV